MHRRLPFAVLAIALGALMLTLAPSLIGFDTPSVSANHRPGHGGSPPTPEPPTPEPPEGCTTCPAMFIRSIVVGANKDINGSTYATCRVVMWDAAGNQLEGINVLHEWSDSASGTEIDMTAPRPPYATSTWVTVNNGPKCQGKNASRIYTCTVLAAWSDDYTYVPTSNWETSDSDEACLP